MKEYAFPNNKCIICEHSFPNGPRVSGKSYILTRLDGEATSSIPVQYPELSSMLGIHVDRGMAVSSIVNRNRVVQANEYMQTNGCNDCR
ncbi:hypothetical protein CEXT_233661 [Caerostris extrusa]|uniref:Uncharacterized protein n=1 Tax=Caerostris extrusa TaxID=172846 RepID=A0AAV4XW10_CAEEX|nr:hypothetical protein CEXT_233661 [Caerostris extrusa]